MILGYRKVMIAGVGILLAGCQVIPKIPTESTPNPDSSTTGAETTPDADVLPTDQNRHRIALLVPLSGSNEGIGKSIANATTMALLDTNASNLRITTYDTAQGARGAARNAVADGNELILGPLLASNVSQVQAEARPSAIPLISFSNDTGVAGPDAFVMGHVPGQSIARSIEFSRARGSKKFAAILPEGEYGRRAEISLRAALGEYGGELAGIEKFNRANTSIISASRRIKNAGGFDTVLIADSSRLTLLASNELRPRGTGAIQILGTELLSGDSTVAKSPSMQGAWFSAVSDARFKRFAESYQARFGTQPYRLATLGYDSVLLTLRVAREWPDGVSFPLDRLRAQDGFLGLDGAFRFTNSSVVDRAMEVREVREGQILIVSPAPTNFDGAKD